MGVELLKIDLNFLFSCMAILLKVYLRHKMLNNLVISSLMGCLQRGRVILSGIGSLSPRAPASAPISGNPASLIHLKRLNINSMRLAVHICHYNVLIRHF